MMRRHNYTLFMASSAAMEICWITTWAVYTSLPLTSTAFPMVMGVVVFFLSAGLTTSLDNNRRIRWHLFFIHAIGWSSSVMAMWGVSRLCGPIDFSRGWQMGLEMGILRTRPAADAQWPVLIFLGVWIFIYWKAGLSWSRRTHAHRAICNRFDLCASLLFLLFILKLLLWKRFDIPIEASSTIYLLGAFFLFGLLSIGLAKNLSEGSEDDRAGRAGNGILPVFVIAIVLFGLSSISFILPYFESAAQRALNAAKTAAGPLSSWFAGLLILIFKASPDSADRLGKSVGEASKAAPPVESILSKNDAFMHGAAMLYGVLFLLLSSAGIWLIYRWLTASGARMVGTRHFPSGTRIIRLIQDAVLDLVQRIRKMWQKKGVGYYYATLIKWGKHSGLAHHGTQTPREFANRLADRFPEVGEQLIKIAEHYNLCIYGGRPPGDAILAELQNARRKILSPRLWPTRLRHLIFRR